MSLWVTKTLGEFVTLQRGHDLTEPDRRPGLVPVMGSAGQNGTHDKSRAPGPGVVIGRSGASFGQVHFVEEDYWPHNTCLYVTDFRGNDPKFPLTLMDLDELVRSVLDQYEKLDQETQRLVPLRKLYWPM